MHLTHDEMISLIELLKGYIECELEDEDDNFSYYDSIYLKLYSQLHDMRITMGITNFLNNSRIRRIERINFVTVR